MLLDQKLADAVTSSSVHDIVLERTLIHLHNIANGTSRNRFVEYLTHCVEYPRAGWRAPRPVAAARAGRAGPVCAASCLLLRTDHSPHHTQHTLSTSNTLQLHSAHNVTKRQFVHESSKQVRDRRRCRCGRAAGRGQNVYRRAAAARCTLRHPRSPRSRSDAAHRSYAQ